MVDRYLGIVQLNYAPPFCSCNKEKYELVFKHPMTIIFQIFFTYNF